MGTDEMRLVHERVAIAAGANRPSLNGQDVQTADYREQIVRGFSSAYRFLMAQRDELLAEQLPRFASDEIRFIARPTSTYARLLWESFHPICCAMRSNVIAFLIAYGWECSGNPPLPGSFALSTLTCFKGMFLCLRRTLRAVIS